MRLAAVICVICLAHPNWALQARAEPAAREWARIEVSKPKFTAEHLGLLEAEVAPFATFLAIHAYNTHAGKIWSGDASAILAARRQLSLALNLCPNNTEAKAINTWLFLKTKQSEPLTQAITPAMFADGLARTITRLRQSPNMTDNIRKAIGYLALTGVDFAPENDQLIYEAEIFLRTFPSESDAWRELHQAKAD
jgi:hypothetical protein